jgi:hypothetical protein
MPEWSHACALVEGERRASEQDREHGRVNAGETLFERQQDDRMKGGYLEKSKVCKSLKPCLSLSLFHS